MSNNFSADDSVVGWIEGLKQKDEHSAQQLWERYFSRLTALAGSKLPGHIRRDFDEEDVALSAFHSMCRGVRQDRFPDLKDRDNLWSLLVVITARKVSHQLRERSAKKRGEGATRGESVFEVDVGAMMAGIDRVIGNSPTPDFALQVSEESERLMQMLPDDSFREVARLKFEGYSNEEISQLSGQSLRTVVRRMSLIRKLWNSEFESEMPAE